MALPALAIPLVTGLAEMGYNIYRGVRSDRALKELNKQRLPRYMDAAAPLQQNYGMAERQYRMGLSPQANALARGTAANQMAGQFRAATDLGGGQLGSAIGRIGALNTNQLGLQLGAQDQAARERGMQQMMGVNQQLSGLQQKDINVDLQRRMQMEQGYGMAKQQAIQGGLGAISGFGQAALYQNIYGTNTSAKSSQPSGDGYFPVDAKTMTQEYMGRNPLSRTSFQTPAQKFGLGPLSNLNDMSKPYSFNDMSGDSDYQSFNNPNALKFSNPYRKNRGFMNSYNAVGNSRGEVMFQPK
jgi:hypothetical protein